jgi:3-dehydroquinate synthase
MSVIPVNLGVRSYAVHVGAGLIANAGELIAPFVGDRRMFIVTDENVWRLHGAALEAGLANSVLANHGINAPIIVLPPGEHTKSFDHLQRVSRDLLAKNIARNDLIIAFGGGVIGDLAGLAAGLVKRGVDFVQVPTTLLAQVDSSVGGKTAIDTPEGKNLIGLIHQPRAVIADTALLSTLPARERRAGYAEIVKAALIADAPFFEWCETNASAIIAADPAALSRAVTTAIAFKARIVEQDETEQGARALLNLGHTFAHALEAHSGYSADLLHGEAVAAGVALAFAFSAEQGLCSAADAARVRAHLNAAGFVTDLRQLPGAPYDPATLLTLMQSDKKAEAGRLTLILARAPGAAFVQKAADAEALAAFLQHETQ